MKTPTSETAATRKKRSVAQRTRVVVALMATEASGFLATNLFSSKTVPGAEGPPYTVPCVGVGPPYTVPVLPEGWAKALLSIAGVEPPYTVSFLGACPVPSLMGILH